MRVKILKSLSGLDFSYRKGQEVELEDNRAKKWIEGEVAVEVKLQTTAKKAPSNTTKSKADG